MKPIFYAFTLAAFGVLIFHLLALPLPWLLGPIFMCLFGALAGIPLRGFKPLNDGMRTILGVAVGASLTPAVLASFPDMWATLLLVPVMIAAIGLIGVPYFRKICGFDFPTAYYAAMPGGLQDMLVFGEEAGANVRALSLVHATRVLVIVVVLPFLLEGIWEADLSSAPGLPATDIPIFELAIMLICAIAGWKIAGFVGLFGASILGPLILTCVVTLAGGLHYRPPAEAIWAAQFFIGMGIGSKYAGVTMAEVKHDLAAGFGFCVILMVLTLLFVEGIYSLGLGAGMETLLAFSPGGQAELTVLALIVGADMAFVVSHHVLRIFVVILGAPVAARLFSTQPPD